MAAVTVLGRGLFLDDLPLWGDLDSLPYSLDSPIWKTAVYYEISDADADVSVEEEFYPEVEISFANAFDIPADGSFNGGLDGYGWITHNEENSPYIWTVEPR